MQDRPPKHGEKDDNPANSPAPSNRKWTSDNRRPMYTCNAGEGPENDEENARRCPLDLAPDRPSGSGLQITHSTRCFEMTFKESSLSRDFVSASGKSGRILEPIGTLRVLIPSRNRPSGVGAGDGRSARARSEPAASPFSLPTSFGRRKCTSPWEYSMVLARSSRLPLEGL